jgi:nitroimidazol reductase NimA-like FMN-containing flavoprotein (pyridoxamine 5'-phosphate oxidase superfamily)
MVKGKYIETDISEVPGNEMEDEEINQILNDLGYGPLALAQNNEAYSVSVSFGYDGDRIFLYLLRSVMIARRSILVNRRNGHA